MCNNDLVRTRSGFIRVLTKMALSLYDLMTRQDFMLLSHISRSLGLRRFTASSSLEGSWICTGSKKAQHTKNSFIALPKILVTHRTERNNVLFFEKFVVCFTNIVLCIVKYSVTHWEFAPCLQLNTVQKNERCQREASEINQFLVLEGIDFLGNSWVAFE